MRKLVSTKGLAPTEIQGNYSLALVGAEKKGNDGCLVHLCTVKARDSKKQIAIALADHSQQDNGSPPKSNRI